MFDIQSILIYVGLALVLFFAAKLAEITNSKKAVWFMVALLTLIAGLRAVTVGIDTKTYDAVFSYVASGNFKSIYGMEESFLDICALLLTIWENNHFLFVGFAFISHTLCLFRLWKDREYIAFRWSVFAYYILFFAFSLNGMRQFVAMSIVFYATAFVREQKYIRFILMVALASLFHTSALVGMAYLFFEMIFLRFFDRKRKMITFLLVVVGGIFGFSILSNLINQYARYFDRQSSSFGIMTIAKFVLLILSVVIIETSSDKKERYRYLSVRWNFFVGLLLNSLNYFFLYMGRIGHYFSIFEVVFIGYLFQTKNKTKWTLLFKFGYAMLLLYYLYNGISSGAQGEMPYRFFWQS